MQKSLLSAIAIASAVSAVLAVPVASLAQTEAASTFAVTPVDLGTAGDFVILSKAGITTNGTTKIVGNLGVSPIASTAITGFSLTMDSTNRFSTSPRVTGKIFAADYAAPTPSKLTTAIGDMQTAYRDAAGRLNPRATELGAGNIGGKTIRHGLYKWSTDVSIPSDVTLLGGPNAVWIFQIAGTLKISAGKKVILTGGAQAKNVFWQVAGKTTLGTTAAFNGNVLGKTAIVMMTGAKFNGRALAQTAVTLDANAIKRNSPPPTTALESLSSPPVSGPY
jgi:hypothetical protein